MNALRNQFVIIFPALLLNAIDNSTVIQRGLLTNLTRRAEQLGSNIWVLVVISTRNKKFKRQKLETGKFKLQVLIYALQKLNVIGTYLVTVTSCIPISSLELRSRWMLQLGLQSNCINLKLVHAVSNTEEMKGQLDVNVDILTRHMLAVKVPRNDRTIQGVMHLTVTRSV